MKKNLFQQLCFLLLNIAVHAQDIIVIDCRQFKLLVSDTSDKEKNENFEKNVFLEFERPQRCTFFCFKRPEMYVWLKTTESNFYLGKVVMPFKFCYSSQMVQIYDYNNKLKYTIKGSCCKCILCCGGCSQKKSCKEGYFKIQNQNQQELTPIKSKVYGCESSCFYAVNDKIIQFRQGDQSQDKILLIATVITVIMHDLTSNQKEEEYIKNQIDNYQLNFLLN